MAFGYVLYAPYWLADRFYGPFHAPGWLRTALPIAMMIIGLGIFVGIGISRRDAFKTRMFSAAILGAFALGTLFVFALHRLA